MTSVDPACRRNRRFSRRMSRSGTNATHISPPRAAEPRRRTRTSLTAKGRRRRLKAGWIRPEKRRVKAGRRRLSRIVLRIFDPGVVDGGEGAHESVLELAQVRKREGGVRELPVPELPADDLFHHVLEMLAGGGLDGPGRGLHGIGQHEDGGLLGARFGSG